MPGLQVTHFLDTIMAWHMACYLIWKAIDQGYFESTSFFHYHIQLPKYTLPQLEKGKGADVATTLNQILKVDESDEAEKVPAPHGMFALCKAHNACLHTKAALMALCMLRYLGCKVSNIHAACLLLCYIDMNVDLCWSQQKMLFLMLATLSASQ
ncbi:hypothetical protein GYMLUDRAFT_63618 [Collybiopsis luxurians FD-317 M1]|uniref:Uncharacterized protein n=1 Tax=Collybiopsis luxurians FD-317 M1 TaxID=944289 RepID=A0A0D0BVF3_9AGAR|nr:hypothetical protein GYMLUDRAFT_63618 [Collybiopsis luxurians FD-317 M1]